MPLPHPVYQQILYVLFTHAFESFHLNPSHHESPSKSPSPLALFFHFSLANGVPPSTLSSDNIFSDNKQENLSNTFTIFQKPKLNYVPSLPTHFIVSHCYCNGIRGPFGGPCLCDFVCLFVLRHVEVPRLRTELSQAVTTLNP